MGRAAVHYISKKEEGANMRHRYRGIPVPPLRARPCSKSLTSNPPTRPSDKCDGGALDEEKSINEL